MKFAQRSALLYLIFLAGDAALAQEATAVWSQLSQPTLAANKSTNVSNLLLARDRIRITLAEGVIHFLEPSGGVVYGAEFHVRLKEKSLGTQGKFEYICQLSASLRGDDSLREYENIRRKRKGQMKHRFLNPYLKPSIH